MEFVRILECELLSCVVRASEVCCGNESVEVVLEGIACCALLHCASF